MASKFAGFLKDNAIDPRRVLIASRRLERLGPEDRALKLGKRRGKAGGSDAKESETPAKKPHSGRPVTPRLLRQASDGIPIPGPAKTRLLRAVNRILEQKKKNPTDLKALF